MAKEKSITDLKDEKKQLISRSKEIIEKAKSEKRQFSKEENEELGDQQERKSPGKVSSGNTAAYGSWNDNDRLPDCSRG